MSPIEHVWDALDRRIHQRVPVPANIQQLCTARRGVDQHSTGHNQQPDQLYAANGGYTIYRLVFGPPQYCKTAHFRVAFYCGQPKALLCNNHAV